MVCAKFAYSDFVLIRMSFFPPLSAAGLAKITVERTAAAFQVTASNPMVGLEGRTSLLTNLSKALKANPQLFGDDGRPGNMVGSSHRSSHPDFKYSRF